MQAEATFIDRDSRHFNEILNFLRAISPPVVQYCACWLSRMAYFQSRSFPEVSENLLYDGFVNTEVKAVVSAAPRRLP